MHTQSPMLSNRPFCLSLVPTAPGFYGQNFSPRMSGDGRTCDYPGLDAQDTEGDMHSSDMKDDGTISISGYSESGDLQELGAHAEPADDPAKDFVDGEFDNAGAGLFSKRRAATGGEPPKRARPSGLPLFAPSDNSQEGGDFFIPGIGSFEETPAAEEEPQIPQPIKESRTQAGRKSAREPTKNSSAQSTAEAERINCTNTPRSVFSKHIFVPAPAAREPDLATPRDPSYLFEPLQCKLCGLRFSAAATAVFGVHIEDHRRKTRALDEKAVLQREFFTSKTTAAPIKLNLSVCGDNEVLVWAREAPKCVVCGEKLKKVWRDDVEDWVLESGARISEKEYAHRECVL
ncbi:hypothetical protein PAPHI01_1629 [Pancytospora philotis]|nr:hypothetical protein PAPHI01_1629 [Pancytospora philotis]